MNSRLNSEYIKYQSDILGKAFQLAYRDGVDIIDLVYQLTHTEYGYKLLLDKDIDAYSSAKYLYNKLKVRMSLKYSNYRPYSEKSVYRLGYWYKQQISESELTPKILYDTFPAYMLLLGGVDESNTGKSGSGIKGFVKFFIKRSISKFYSKR